jgi:hypothetical protein
MGIPVGGHSYAAVVAAVLSNHRMKLSGRGHRMASELAFTSRAPQLMRER